MADGELVKASVRVPAGKHYGTEVVITHPSGIAYPINVWLPIGEPSEEALDEWEVTPEQWKANAEVPDGWGGLEPIRNMFPCDSHYQSLFEREVAVRIAEALNDMRWP